MKTSKNIVRKSTLIILLTLFTAGAVLTANASSNRHYAKQKSGNNPIIATEAAAMHTPDKQCGATVKPVYRYKAHSTNGKGPVKRVQVGTQKVCDQNH